VPVVQNIIKNSVGQVLDGVGVQIKLIDKVTEEDVTQGFIDLAGVNNDYTINLLGTLTTNEQGLWSATLEGNANIDATGDGTKSDTYYLITETYNNISYSYRIDMPTTGGPYWVGNPTINLDAS